jgi:DNA-binding MarR family transcriptional regulator
VRREVAAHDRRCTALRLTPAGRRIAGAERDRYHAKVVELFDGLDRAEREQAERLLGRLADLIEEL